MAAPAPTAATRSSRSARAKAQRPQLVPRASEAAANDDPDVSAISDRTPDAPDWPEEGRQAKPESVPFVPPGAAGALNLNPKPTPSPALSLVPSNIHDIDLLWDWCREDPQGTQAFLGIAPDHSRALQDHIGGLLLLEQKGVAWLRTIKAESVAIGFVSLLPVHRDVAEPYGDAHCYLMPALQGHLAQLLPGILAEGARLEPTLTFRVFTPDYAFARLLQPHGFTLNIVLTRPASVGKSR